MSCKFILSDVVEDELAADDGYSLFEPTVALEINGKNVFHSVGIDGAQITVVMHFREQALRETERMVHDLSDQDEGQYKCWLLGTGFGFRLERKGRTLNVFLIVDNFGPTQGVSWPQKVHVGAVSVSEWVEAIVSLSGALTQMFRRLNPSILSDPLVQKEEEKVSRLEKWLRP